MYSDSMSQSAIVAIASAFVTKGVLVWAFPEMGKSTSWLIAGAIALAIGLITMKAGERKTARKGGIKKKKR